jgi:hypothetical protein
VQTGWEDIVVDREDVFGNTLDVTKLLSLGGALLEGLTFEGEGVVPKWLGLRGRAEMRKPSCSA